jgi:glycosyltransferase involved in cell wall biosynthesis
VPSRSIAPPLVLIEPLAYPRHRERIRCSAHGGTRFTLAMNANDDVTIVITCFNYGAFLAEAVDSALDQEGGEPRVLVVDDGSTDTQTRTALERLPPQVDAARNAGLALADTPFVLVLDADDRLTPRAIAQLRELLESEPDLGFAYGPMRFFGAWDGVLEFPDYDPYRLLYRHTIGSSALMRRELVEDIGGFDPTFPGYEDWELWVHALARGWRGRRIADITLLYRRHTATRHLAARARYRETFRQLRAKHAATYSRTGRKRVAAESELGALGRVVYRFWWGFRPLPARVELSLQSAFWRPK